MGRFNKHYEIKKDAPKEIEWEKYRTESIEEYHALLSTCGDCEKEFQDFLEKNPSYVPGALSLFGQSGHYPFMDTLISQPEIGITFTRKPDFLWLAQDSLTFSPVFIEIEKPNKKMFTDGGIPNADFNQALNQIDEWRYLLKDSDNIRAFYKSFSIPLHLQEKIFNPQFLLIFGRRDEYGENPKLSGVRASKQRDNVAIMSFDRLKPLYDYKQFTSCKMSQGKYRVLHIPPTFRYRADLVDTLKQYVDFQSAISLMEKTSEDRKKFLLERFSYWVDNAEYIMSGLLVSQEGE